MQNDITPYIDGVLAGDRRLLARTITLIESALPEHQQVVNQIIEELLPHTGKAIRVGITGVPGAGKSTFIDSFGSLLTKHGHRVAVLAIDPSSVRSGGSVLGDKTRMLNLSTNDNAFIRPSPSGGTLGGVARKTRETMLACEAAGFDVIIVETVGVGQSETAVASMVDFFLILMIAGAGDELQGIKKGILEVADAIVINKADGDNVLRAERARREYETALHLLSAGSKDWSPQVMACSAMEMSGLDEIWEMIGRYRLIMETNGELKLNRNHQALDWMRFLLDEGLRSWFYAHPEINRRLPELLRDVEDQEVSPTSAALELLKHLDTPTD
jgi:LAO/AO transport system kinase